MDKLNSKLPKKMYVCRFSGRESNRNSIRRKRILPLSLGHSLEGVKIYGVKMLMN
jgi:hypothetical protein